MRSTGEQLLREARAIRRAYPDCAAMRAVLIGLVPTGNEWPALISALRHLRAEMVLVQAGDAGGIWVLDDEMASVERILTDRC